MERPKVMSELSPLSELRMQALRLLSLRIARQSGVVTPALMSQLESAKPEPAVIRLLEYVLQGFWTLLGKVEWRLQTDGPDSTRAWLDGDLSWSEGREIEAAGARLAREEDLLRLLRDLRATEEQGPPRDDQGIFTAMRHLLRVLRTPRSLDELRMEEDVCRELERSMRVLKEAGRSDLVHRVTQAWPDRHGLDRRRSACLVEGGEVFRPDGTTATVTPFAVEPVPMGPKGLRRFDAERRVLELGLRLPSYDQMLRLIQLKPTRIRLPRGGLEWLRPRERRGRHHFGAAFLLSRPPELLWLPAHLPGREVVARGVLELGAGRG